jgi:predicted kinase
LALIVFGGLPGSGKSTLARALGGSLRAPVLSVDPIEAALWRAGIDPKQPTGLAAYVVAEALAERQLELGLITVIDAANYVEPARQMWRDLATRRRVRLRWIEVVCSVEPVHRSRIEARRVDIPGFYAVSWSDVVRRRTETEPWIDERLVLDTAVTDDQTLLARAVAHVA